MSRTWKDLRRCPTCGIALGAMGDDGRLEEVCSGCRFKFRFLKGTLAPYKGSGDFALNRPAVPGESSSLTPKRGAFHLMLPGGGVETVIFKGPELAEWVWGRFGHTVSVVHTMRGRLVEDLVSLNDETDGSVRKTASPGQFATTMARGAASVAFLGAVVLLAAVGLTQLGAAGWILALSGAGAASAGAYKLVKKPSHPLTREEQFRLSQRQDLLTRIDSAQSTQLAAYSDRAIKVRQADRLIQLAAKMRSVDAKLYSTRLARLDRILEMLQRQMGLDDNLVEGYDKAIAMLEIEVESLDAAQVIGDSAIARIEDKIEEVAALKRMHAELEAQLAAYEEVERYLSPSEQGGALNP